MGALMPVAGRLYDKIGPRWPATIGLLIVAFGTYELHRRHRRHDPRAHDVAARLPRLRDGPGHDADHDRWHLGHPAGAGQPRECVQQRRATHHGGARAGRADRDPDRPAGPAAGRPHRADPSGRRDPPAAGGRGSGGRVRRRLRGVPADQQPGLRRRAGRAVHHHLGAHPGRGGAGADAAQRPGPGSGRRTDPAVRARRAGGATSRAVGGTHRVGRAGPGAGTRGSGAGHRKAATGTPGTGTRGTTGAAPRSPSGSRRAPVSERRPIRWPSRPAPDAAGPVTGRTSADNPGATVVV